MTLLANLKLELQAASRLTESAERAVVIASIVAEALKTMRQDPILVGGAAVEFYTQGAYTTADIDMVAEGGADLVKVMAELGFEKVGKDFIDKKNRIYIEFPGRKLGPTEQINTIQIGKRFLKIISVEDLIVDRLCAYKFWRSAIDGINALLLLEMEEVDDNRLKQRTTEEFVVDALQAVQKIREEVIRKKLPRRKANRMIEEKIRGF